MGVLCSGILSNLNGHKLDGLSIEEPGDTEWVEVIEKGLDESWGIEDRDELLDMLKWLSEAGRKVRYATFCTAKNADALMSADMDEDEQEGVLRGFRFASHFKQSKKESALLGWDSGRSALLTRFGFYVGWLSEIELLTADILGTPGEWGLFPWLKLC